MTGAARKVLIVDDEPDVREFIREVLEEDGYAFIEAEDGEAAVQIAGAESPDVVILDLQMPKKDGFQAFYELRNNEATKSIPVIILTAVTERTGLKFDAGNMGQYFGSEPEAYIEKPIDPEKLPAVVKSAIEQASTG